MDLYDFALTMLRADNRSPYELARLTGLPRETIRDVRSGLIQSPRIDIIRRLNEFYRSELIGQQ